MAKEGNGLWLVGIGYAKLVASQVGDGLSLGIEGHHVQFHHLRLRLRGVIPVKLPRRIAVKLRHAER